MILIFVAQAVEAQTRTWTGSTNSNWATASNWSGGNVPGPGENVVINNGAFAPDFNTTLTINNLTVGNWGPTAPLNVVGGTLTVTGGVTLNGGGQLNIVGGTLNHTGNSFSFSFGSNLAVHVSAGLLSTNATNFTINSSMQMSGGEFVANGGLTVGSSKTFTQSAGKIRVTGHLNISSSNAQMVLGSDSLLLNGRLTLGTNSNFYGGNANILVNRQSGQNNQISGNWYTQGANIIFNPSVPMGNNLTSISSSGAKFYAGQGAVVFNDSVFIGSNADLFGDSGEVTFSRSLQVSSGGAVSNGIGTLNFEGNATFKSSGTLNAGNGAVNFGGDVSVDNSNGVINANAATIVVQGDLSNSGTFNAGTSTVVFDGDSDQVISNDIVFYDLIIQTTGSLTAGGNVTVLNDGVIGDSTEIVLDDNQLNVQGELTDNGGNLAVATAKPFVVSGSTPTNLKFELVFNEALNTSANTISNYNISPARTITAASRNDSIVQLTVSTVLDTSVEYTVTMNNIQNLESVAVNSNHIKRIRPSFAVSPSLQASEIQIDLPETNKLRLRIKRGNGSRVLVLARSGGAVNGNPTNATAYSANLQFGVGSQIGQGNFVVYTGNDSLFTVTNLSPNTIYHFTAFEYNGSGSGIQYNLTNVPVANRATLAAIPSQQVVLSAFSALSFNSFTTNWTPGNGTHRLLLIRANAPITVQPSAGVQYSASDTFGQGSLLGDSTYVVYFGTSTSQSGLISGLQANTKYFVQAFEVNVGVTGSNNYLVQNAPMDSVVTALNTPTIAASNFKLTAVSATSMQLSWTKGNGERSLVVGRLNGVVSAPSNGTAYLADSVWAEGSSIPTTSFVVYADTGSSVIINGLTASSNYRFKVFTYSGVATSTAYLLTDVPELSRFTLPANLVSNPTFDQIAAESFRLSWQGGNTAKMVVMRREAAVNVYPAQGANYPANTAFGSGTDLGDSNFVVYSGTANQVLITNLDQNTTYHVAVFDFAGSDATRTYAFSPAIATSRFTFLKLGIKVFLQGPYNGTGLEANLVADLPLNQPYNTAPWNYAGNESVEAIPNDSVVDWVYIQTRKAPSASQAIQDSITAETAALLLTDGSIVGLNGQDYITMPISQPGNQFVVIFHRTHIPIMSNSAVIFDEDAFYFDFTSGQNQAFGTDPQQLLKAGVWGMYSGRVEQMTPYLIDSADIQQVWADKNMEGGYADSDAVLEGLVDATDRSVVWNNRNRASQVP